MKRVLHLLVLTALACSQTFAQDDKSSDDDPEKKLNQQLQKLNQKYAESYKIIAKGDENPLELNPEPVFNWVNAARVNNDNVQKGAVYVWTKDGRAEVVGTIFSAKNRGSDDATFYHEFHSLATVPLKATVNRTKRWDTPDPGVNFTAFADAEVPPESAARRLTEMRAFARKFSGYSINYDDARWGLNLLPTPLYRMPKPTAEVLDQAVFALISTAGTDPEVLLVIEARKEKEAFQWQYAVCRFTDLKTFISLGDQQIWSFENGTNPAKGPNVDSDMASKYRFINAGNVRVQY